MIKKKFYAVRIGRKPGVFDNWKIAEKQVLKFKGAVYQSFDNPKTAWDFVRLPDQEFQNRFFANNSSQVEQNEKISNSLESAIAYTDGSFDQITNTYSYGAVILWKQKTIKLSCRFQNERDVSLRNVAGELEGAKRALRFAKTNKIKYLTLYHDYEGIAAWANGTWKTNLPLTQEYANFVKEIHQTVKVNFVWVKGHSGDYYNEMVDRLASEATFKEYRKVE